VAGVQLFPDEVLKSAGQMVPAQRTELLPEQQKTKCNFRTGIMLGFFSLHVHPLYDIFVFVSTIGRFKMKLPAGCRKRTLALFGRFFTKIKS
jgi:hypothetical protein